MTDGSRTKTLAAVVTQVDHAGVPAMATRMEHDGHRPGHADPVAPTDTW